ncbi:hypothetical protein [Georgenia sp. SUBG003]|uniref:hypothetical protein n=1 Tax=Georgenia sp. SUBG003 TaxID=1497974 RepID=UPI003AB15338
MQQTERRGRGRGGELGGPVPPGRQPGDAGRGLWQGRGRVGNAQVLVRTFRPVAVPDGGHAGVAGHDGDLPKDA